MLVYVVGADALDGPTRALPDPLLAHILAAVEVKRTAVDLDEGVLRGPAQVRFLSGDADVEQRQAESGVAEDLDRADLGSAARALDRKPAVSRDDRTEAAGTTAATVVAEAVRDASDRRLLEPDRLSHRPRERPFGDSRGEVQKRSRHRGDRDVPQRRGM